MSNLSTFDIIAGLASIASLVITLTLLIHKSVRSYRDKRDSAESEFNKEISRLTNAAQTISARTDLGFFVVMEVGSLRDSVNKIRHESTRYAVLVGLCSLLVLLCDWVGIPQRSPLILILLLVAALSGIMILVKGAIENRLSDYTKSYESRIKAVWEDQINKRAPRPKEEEPVGS